MPSPLTGRGQLPCPSCRTPLPVGAPDPATPNVRLCSSCGESSNVRDLLKAYGARTGHLFVFAASLGGIGYGLASPYRDVLIVLGGIAAVWAVFRITRQSDALKKFSG